MKNFVQLLGVSVFTLLLSVICFGQGQQSVKKITPVAIGNLTNEVIQIPADTSLAEFKFFSLKIDSLSQVTINLFDENKIQNSKIVIKEDVLRKAVQYSISSTNSTPEWVRIERTGELGKDIANAVSSSGRSMKIVTYKGVSKSDCKDKIPASAFEITVDNGIPRQLAGDNLHSKMGKDNLRTFLEQNEGMFYDTFQLKILRNVLSSFENLRNIVVEKSTKKEANASFLEESGFVPNCNVLCVRIGTIVPIYACNDDALNCGRCGVDGFYIIGGYGCIAICSIACKEFSPEIV